MPKADSAGLTLSRIPGLPLVEPGDIAAMITGALAENGIEPADGDIFAVAQKIVSKAERRQVDLDTVEPSAQACRLADEAGKDPRVVELILRQSTRVVRHRPGVIIVEHRLGLVLANAGIDRSNVTGDGDHVLLLPEDPDKSAADLRHKLTNALGRQIGVIVTDSIGRAWRLGTTGTAIGCAGVPALEDLRGCPDLFGRKLEVSETATADGLAAAAGLLMGEGRENTPVVLIRGIGARDTGQTARSLLRPAGEDLFR